LLDRGFGAFDRLGRLARQRRRRWRLRGTVAAGLATNQIESLELLEWIRATAQPPIAVIHDLGANIGTWTALARAVFPSAVIHAFEPLPAHADSFERRTAGWPDVTLHRVALGATNGTAPLHVTSFSDSASLRPLANAGRDYFGLTDGPTVTVPVATLNDWCTRTNVPVPDLLKLDLQGFELDALRGAENLLPRVRYVLTEVSFAEFYRGQALFTSISRYLADHGFHFAGLGQTTTAPLVQADALFTRQASTL
jgi:FkbM family methyltransferase